MPSEDTQTYQIRVLKEHSLLVINACLSIRVRGMPRVKKYKNTEIVEAVVYEDTAADLFFILKSMNIPFVIRGVKHTNTKTYHTINQDYKFTSTRKPAPNWVEQEERYKFYKMLKITGS